MSGFFHFLYLIIIFDLSSFYNIKIMLKSLFNRIKSEKSESFSIKNQKVAEHVIQNQEMKPIEEYQFKALGQKSIVYQSISKIRYSVQPQAPKIYNRILSCPISVFNLLPYGKRKVKEIDLRHHPCPQYIDHLKKLLGQELPQFNHLLINVYPPGIGIMPHFDGPMYKQKVVVLSLGGPALINFSQNYQNTSKVASLLLENQSVHIFQRQAYKNYLHGIADFSIDSIFIKIVKNEQTQEFQILNASVGNFRLTKLCNVVLQALKDFSTILAKNEQIDLTKQYGPPTCLLPIIGNPEYNFKVQIVREERISITIREQQYES